VTCGISLSFFQRVVTGYRDLDSNQVEILIVQLFGDEHTHTSASSYPLFLADYYLFFLFFWCNFFRARKFTDTGNFTLRCGVCQKGVVGQAVSGS
jgi:hypothetical protein